MRKKLIVLPLLITLLLLLLPVSFGEEALQVSANLNVTTVEVGTAISVNAQATGGSGNYQYRYEWYAIVEGVESLLNTSRYQDKSYDAQVINYGQTGHVEVWVKDGDNEASHRADFTITGYEPLKIQALLEKDTIKAAAPLTVNAQATGGTAPYLYRYSVSIINDGKALECNHLQSEYQKNAQYTWDGLYGQSGVVTVEVKDAFDFEKKIEIPFTITGYAPLRASAELSSAQVSVDNDISVTVTATGGKPPYTYEYHWVIYDNYDNKENGYDSYFYDQTSNISVLPIQQGQKGKVEIWVYDSVGFSIYGPECSFLIEGDPPFNAITALSAETVEVGKNLTVQVTPTGGKAPYSYRYVWTAINSGQYSTWATIDTSAEQTNTQTIPIGQSGYVDIVIEDGLGRKVEQRCDFTITGYAPLEATAKLSSDSVEAGQALTLSVNATGGKAPYTYSFCWQVFDGLYDSFYGWEYYGDSSYVADSSQTKIITYGQKGTVIVTVQDAFGATVNTDSIPFTITGYDPMQLEAKLNPKNVKEGEEVTLTIDIGARGGKAPYTYQYKWYNGSLEDLVTSTDFIQDTSCTQTMIVQYPCVEVTVKDAIGRTYMERFDFETEWEKSLGISASLSANSVAVGDPLTVTATATGGKKPYQYQYLWVVSDGVEDYNKDTYTIADTDYTLMSSNRQVIQFGQFGQVWATVKDAEGNTTTTIVDYDNLSFSIYGYDTMKVVAQLETDSVKAGDAATVNVKIMGGKAPYSYRYEWFVMDNGKSREIATTDFTSAHSDTQQIPFGQEGCVYVYVKDSIGHKMVEYKEACFIVTGYSSMQATGVLSANQVEAGQELTVKANVTSGIAPYTYRYEWYVTDSEDEPTLFAQTKEFGTGNAHTQKIPDGTHGYAICYIKDSVGAIVETTQLPFTITMPESTPKPTPVNGDASGDGIVDILDLVSIIDHIVSGTLCASMDNADANGDGVVDILDLVWIIDKIVAA